MDPSAAARRSTARGARATPGAAPTAARVPAPRPPSPHLDGCDEPGRPDKAEPGVEDLQDGRTLWASTGRQIQVRSAPWTCLRAAANASARGAGQPRGVRATLLRLARLVGASSSEDSLGLLQPHLRKGQHVLCLLEGDCPALGQHRQHGQIQHVRPGKPRQETGGQWLSSQAFAAAPSCRRGAPLPTAPPVTRMQGCDTTHQLSAKAPL